MPVICVRDMPVITLVDKDKTTMSITVTSDNSQTTYYIYKKYGKIANHHSMTEATE